MAGAGYKLFNTGDVLTAAQVNTYLNEQTVMVFASSAARTSALSGVLAEGMMSYLQDTNSVEVYNGTSWVNVGNAGDITEVQAGVGISIASGTGPIPVITNSSTDLITTAGDILYGTAADTMARLGIGTAGQVLKVNSGATAPEWGAASGGAWTSLYTVTMTGASSITQATDFTGYRQAVVEYENVTCGATWNLQTKLNNSTTDLYVQVLSNNATTVDSSTATSIVQTGSGGAQKTGTRLDGLLTINNPASTAAFKAVDYQSTYTRNTAGDPLWSLTNKGFFRSASAITSIVFDTNGTNFTGGTIRIYGVK